MTDGPQRARRSGPTSWLPLALAIAGVLALTLLPIGWKLNRFVVWIWDKLKLLGKALREDTMEDYVLS